MSPKPLTLESLAARLADGEAIAADAIPTELQADPGIQRLLALSRVLHQFDLNADLPGQEPALPPRPLRTLSSAAPAR